MIDDGRGWVFVQAKDDPTRFERREVASQGGQGPKGFFVVRSSSHNEPEPVATEGLAAGETLLANIAAEDSSRVQTAPAVLKSKPRTPGESQSATEVRTDQEAPPVAPPA